MKTTSLDHFRQPSSFTDPSTFVRSLQSHNSTIPNSFAIALHNSQHDNINDGELFGDKLGYPNVKATELTFATPLNMENKYNNSVGESQEEEEEPHARNSDDLTPTGTLN